MDNFMDKLVEKINAQGATRAQSLASQGMTAGQEGAARISSVQMTDLEERISAKASEKVSEKITEQLSGKVTEEIVEKVTAEVNAKVTESVSAVIKDGNAKNVEMIAAFQKDNQEKYSKLEEALSEHVHKENVKCYRNTQAALEESVTKQNDSITESVKGKFTGIRNLLIAVMILLGVNIAGAVVIILKLFGLL